MPNDIDDVTDVILIRELQEKGSIDPTDLYLLQTTNQSYKLSHDDLVAALPDNSTIEVNPATNKLKVSDNFLNVDINLFDDVDQNHGQLASSKAIKDYVDAIETGSGTSVFVPIIPLEKFDQTANTSYTYNVVTDFTSLDQSYEPSRVVGIYVECYTFWALNADDSGANRIQANIGNTTDYYTIFQSHGNNGDDDNGSGSLVFIPFRLGQTEIKLQINTEGVSGSTGGSNGVGNRRGWRIVGVSQSTTEIVQTPVVNTTLFKYGEIQVGDIAGSPTGALTTTGDFTSSKVVQGNNGSTITCTFINPLPTDKYNLLFEIISLADVQYDQDLKEVIVLSKSSTGFEFNLEETNNIGQNLQINVRVESNIPSDMGVIQEWEVRTDSNSSDPSLQEQWDTYFVNDTGYPMILRAYGQDSGSGQIEVNIEIDGLNIAFLHAFGDTAVDDTAEITIPAGSTWKLLNNNIAFDSWKTWTLKTTPVVGNSDNLETTETTEITIGDLAPNGWTKLPNGLIMQWGVVTVAASSDESVSFPIPFNTVFNVVITEAETIGRGTNQSHNLFIKFNSLTNTEFTIESANSLKWDVYWQALGM
jgi:hypothetical protein